jgi:hypothetical protein
MYLLIQDSSQTTNNTLLGQRLISPKSKHQIGVGIGGIGDGRGFSVYHPDFVGEVGNFTDFFPTWSISTATVAG